LWSFRWREGSRCGRWTRTARRDDRSGLV